MNFAIIITVCVLLLLAYLFTITSSKTKIPSVILLLLLGWAVRQTTEVLHIIVPDLNPLLPFFGTIGLILIGYWKWALAIIGIAVILFFASILSKNITIKGYSIQKLLHKINEIPKKIHRKNILLGVCRYLVFSHQYYVLFLVFDVDLPYLTLISSIAAVYFLASSLPSFQFLDFAVKGSVAMFFFGKYGVNEWIVIFISTLMWFLNVVLPVVIGSYYVMRFKLNTSK